MKTYRKPNKQLFSPIGGHSVTLTKNMKTYIRRQQHKKCKHQDRKQKESPQKYRLGTISNTKLLDGLSGFWSGNLFLIAPTPDLFLRLT